MAAEASRSLGLRRDDEEMDVEAELPPVQAGLDSTNADDEAATKLQKAYRGYRTRRKLADSAVLVEELWWQVLDVTRLNQTTISFFDEPKSKSTTSLWNRVSVNASKVGKGLSRDDKALKLALEHWIEANCRSTHVIVLGTTCISIMMLDVGTGKAVDLPECPRTQLKKQCIKYLGPHQRKLYEYIIKEGKIIHKLSGEPLDTRQGPKGAKWIFVMSTAKRLYAGQKEKGVFQHSSFLAGGATIAAGRFTAENGVIKSIWAYSGHYKPSVENLSNFMNFLEENGVDLKEVEVDSFSKEFSNDNPVISDTQNLAATISTPPQVILPLKITECSEGGSASTEQAKPTYQRTLSGGLHSPKAINVPQKAILERMNSKSECESYQLGHKLSLKWSTEAGPRIGCVKDYPMELRRQALEMVDLSPEDLAAHH
ncbi:hypothetical protein ACP4OV_003230 [Aristida adscensionis]